MTRLKRILLFGGVVVALIGLYEVVTDFVAYTDDAYVRTDLVTVAPEVPGRILVVHVADNQRVKRGDPLLSLDPTPFKLVVAQRQAEIDAARAETAADQQSVAIAQDRYAAATSAFSFAQETQQRVSKLSVAGDIAKQSLDRANDDLRRAVDARSSATAAIVQSQSVAGMHKASLLRSEADLALAQWSLSRTEIASPVDGIVNNLTLREGDTATLNVPLIGILDDKAWRIIANYKQSFLRGFKPGDRAWVWLDSQPWHLHRGHISSISRGISRDETQSALLPYVAPTTDWIRLQRRFPVTVVLDGPPPDAALFMGADARVIVGP